MFFTFFPSNEFRKNMSDAGQRVTRCLFWLSRQDRDFASFSLVPRDEIEIFSQNLRVRDEIEIFVHWISGFETRSRFSVIWSRNSRRDRDFSMKFFLPCDIQNCIFLYTTNTYSWIRKSPKYVFHVDSKKSVLLLLLQPLLLQIIIEEVELLFARSIVSLALSLLDDSLHQAKCVLLASLCNLVLAVPLERLQELPILLQHDQLLDLWWCKASPKWKNY